jgi:two-component system sensor histidine kinase KdpD
MIAGYALAILGVGAMTAALVLIRTETNAFSKGAVLLVIVSAAAAAGGLWPGLVAAACGFFCLDFFLLGPPYDEFIVGPRSITFLATSVLAAVYLARRKPRRSPVVTAQTDHSSARLRFPPPGTLDS